MKLKFKKQQYQEDAVMSVINCFDGQSKGTRKELFARYIKTIDKGTLLEHSEQIEVISFVNNPITLTQSEIRKNIREVQNQNDINYTDNEPITDFSIEMETGTGKTYTYIKTMYELNNYYGWSKFIVMVPSIAIREGVLKSFEITQEHFQEIYHKKIKFFVYDSKNSTNITNISTFASDDSIQVMIINYQAFSAKGAANRRIYEELDELQTRKPIDVIKSVKPILIIDEPQKFGDKTESLFEEFNPLFKIRYSATHKKGKEYNKIYRLDAIDAYNEKLVKKITVKGIEVLNNQAKDTYLFLDKVNITKKEPEAIMELEVKTATGTTRKLMKIKQGDNLYVKSGGLASYKDGYVVSEIDGRFDTYDKVRFINGVEISLGQAIGDIDKEHMARIQIRETINSHLKKEKELYKFGIKVLSLFFIDEVVKYKEYEDGRALKGQYALIFEEEYTKALAEYRALIDDEYNKYLDSFDTGKIHAGYFSIDKKGQLKDPLINDKKEYLSFDEDAYDLIMKDKERLLSLEEPVRFIFSHSALREGWDNPNIFQICTLKHSNSEISKRQEIGRGLRICVNNNGERMDYKTLEDNFHNINTLTVVASQSYESFSKALQTEMAETLTSRPKNFTQESFINKILKNENGEKFVFTESSYNKLLFFNAQKGYIDLDNDSKITDKFIEDLEKDKLEIMPDLLDFKEELIRLMKRLYSSNSTKIISDERRENIDSLIPNSNFENEEFQYLWNKINEKTVYQVSFDTDKLIEKAIIKINEKLNVSKIKARITEGTQKEKITAVSLKNNESMTESKSKIELLEDFTSSQIAHDLIGEIAKDTGLTRKTIISILSGISPQKFEIYKYNPEEFIRKVIKLIKQEKAYAVIDGIKYNKLDQKYSSDIFTIKNVHGELGENAIEVKRNVYDFLIADSKIEINFAKKLETGEVAVYAKLPSEFKISTPVGNYNPDWAVVFTNNNFKYKYAIVETKGSNDTDELREIEKAKIECAKKHFQSLGNDDIIYLSVNSYEELIDRLLQYN